LPPTQKKPFSTHILFSQGNKKTQKRNKKAEDKVIVKKAKEGVVTSARDASFKGLDAEAVHDNIMVVKILLNKLHKENPAPKDERIVFAAGRPFPCTVCGYMRNMGEVTVLLCACEWYKLHGTRHKFFPKKLVVCGCGSHRFSDGKFVACKCIQVLQDDAVGKGLWR